MDKNELQERLIQFAVLIIKITNSLLNNKAGNHLAGQIVRSGTSPALNYGEAQGAESRNDFIHKISIVLKELRETNINLIIIQRVKLSQNEKEIAFAIKESNELISIFVKSLNTAKKNQELKIK